MMSSVLLVDCSDYRHSVITRLLTKKINHFIDFNMILLLMLEIYSVGFCVLK